MQSGQVRRREFITLLGGMAAAWPLATRAQQPRMPVVGFLSSGSPNALVDLVAAFHSGLAETGYVEHRNVDIEYRWAEGQYDRLPALAADLVRRQVTAIVTSGGTPSVLAAKSATTTIPIVFSTASDPVAGGYVASLKRPGGNLTGITTLNVRVGPKRLELLHELAPTAGTIALLVNPSNPAAETELRDLQTPIRTLGLQLHVLRANTERTIDDAFAALVQLRAGGLLIGPDPFFNTRSEQLAVSALRNGVPAIYQYRKFVAAGGLMSYGGSLTDQYRQIAVYVGRILKGEKPADMPVQQGTKVELLLNLKTAKALGITVPLTLLGRADDVIE